MSLLKLSFITLLTVSACRTPPKPVTIAPKPLPAKVRQDYLRPGDIKRIRTGEFVKTYHVGRNVRSRGGSTMHEAHRVYRLEKPSRWNLARDQPPLASTGPVNRVIDSAFKPAPESKALRAELNRQRELSIDLEQARDQLRGAVRETSNRLSDSAANVRANAELQHEIDRLEAENASLKDSMAREQSTPAKVKRSPNALQTWGDNLESPDGD